MKMIIAEQSIIMSLAEANKAITDCAEALEKLEQGFAMAGVAMLMEELCNYYGLDLLNVYYKLKDTARAVNEEDPTPCYRGIHERSN